jgi:hypothetical protein
MINVQNVVDSQRQVKNGASVFPNAFYGPNNWLF